MSKRNRNEKNSAAPRAGVWDSWLPLILIAGLTFLAYFMTFNGAFQFDDWGSIIETPEITGFDLKSILLTVHRPLLRLTFALNYWLGGGNSQTLPSPFGFHLINFLLHLANAYLLFLLGRKLLARFKNGPILALFAALFFALHPVNVETVAYITSRSSLLCGFFLLLGVYFYLLYRERGNTSYLVGSLLMYPLSFLAKPIGIIFPFVILLLEMILPQKGGEESQSRPDWGKTLPFWGLLVLGAVVIWVSQGSLGGMLTDFTKRSIPTHIYSELAVLATYFRLMILPVNLNLDYDYPLYTGLMQWKPLLGLALLLATCGGMVYFYRRQKVLFFALGFMLLNLLTVTAPILADLIFEHHLYLPLMGFALLVFVSLELIREKCKWQFESLAIFAAVVLLLLGQGTFRRSLVWVSEESLWKDVLQKSPAKSRPHYNYGLPLAKRFANYPEAVKEFNKALELAGPSESDQMRAEYNYNLAAAYYYMGEKAEIEKNQAQAVQDWAESEKYSRECIRLFAEHPQVYGNLGNVYLKRGKWQEAIPLYLKALDLTKGQNFKVWGNLGAAYYYAGDSAKSIEALQKSLEQNPDQAAVYSNVVSICRAFARPDLAGQILQSNLPRIHDPAVRQQVENMLRN